MSLILAQGTMTTTPVFIDSRTIHTGRFGLMLNGDFDGGHFDVLFGIVGNHQFPKYPGINPAGVFSTQNFTVNGFYYIEGFCEEIDLRIQNALGSQSVNFVLFVGERP